jgi:type IV pilus assembly protein PilO
MKLSLSKRDQLIVLFGALLLVLLFVSGHFALLSPLKSDLAKKEQTLKTEQQLLDSITQNTNAETLKVSEDSKELQKRVPVTPLQEQFILDLERAENVSNSKIKSMGFSKDADVTFEAPVTENTEESDIPEVKTVQEEMVAEEAAAATPVTGLKKLSVSLSVESPTYEDLEKFIETLESLTRIVVVESINYTGGEEVTTLDTEVEPLAYSISISAYYLPTLDNLIAELPKIDSPAPGQKKNPLTTFSESKTSN